MPTATGAASESKNAQDALAGGEDQQQEGRARHGVVPGRDPSGAAGALVAAGAEVLPHERLRRAAPAHRDE
jgi:hypothetical protein